MNVTSYISGKRAVFAVVVCLSVAAYGFALRLPFIADDYLQIELGRAYGSTEGWQSVLSDPLYRCRQISLVLTYWTERAFGLNHAAFNLSSLLLHMANASMICLLGLWRIAGRRVAAIAAILFAVSERHQEAVIWYAALPELTVAFFVLASVVMWLRWLRGRGAWWYAGSLAAYGAALLSKESAVVVGPLLLLIAATERVAFRRALLVCAPYLAVAAGYALLIFAARDQHWHFNDAGTFSLSAPFPATLARSLWRALWIWGFLAIAWLAWRRRMPPVVWAALVWSAVAFLPYSFLTYMPHVPSRHTYLASVGISLLIAAALVDMWDRMGRVRPWIPAAAAALFIAVNCGYLWTVKQRQFEQRAQPTLRLIEHARQASGDTLQVGCFPYHPEIARAAIEVELGRSVVLSTVANAPDFCAPTR